MVTDQECIACRELVSRHSVAIARLEAADAANQAEKTRIYRDFEELTARLTELHSGQIEIQKQIQQTYGVLIGVRWVGSLLALASSIAAAMAAFYVG